MSKSLILILFIFGLWFAIVKKNKNPYFGGTSKGGRTHSSGGGGF